MRTRERIDSLARRLLHELGRPAKDDLRILQLVKDMTQQDGYRPAWIEKRGDITSLCMRGIPGLHQIESVLLRKIPGSPFYERMGKDFESVWYDLRVSVETYLARAPEDEQNGSGLSHGIKTNTPRGYVSRSYLAYDARAGQKPENAFLRICTSRLSQLIRSDGFPPHESFPGGVEAFSIEKVNEWLSKRGKEKIPV